MSVTVATVVAWLGNRFLAFRARRERPVWREGLLFAFSNPYVLVIAALCLFVPYYVLGFVSPLAVNIDTGQALQSEHLASVSVRVSDAIDRDIRTAGESLPHARIDFTIDQHAFDIHWPLVRGPGTSSDVPSVAQQRVDDGSTYLAAGTQHERTFAHSS